MTVLFLYTPLLLAVLTLLCCPFRPIHGQLDYWDSLGSVPGGVWQSNVFTAFPGFCLPPAQRAIANFSSPLYSAPIHLGVVLGNDDSFVWNFVAKILIQEVIGYTVMIRDDLIDAPSSSSWILMMINNSLYDPTADLVATSGYAELDVSAFDTVYQNMVEIRQDVTSYGTYSAYERTGMYIPSRVAMQTPYDVYDWTTWSGGVNNPLFPSVWLPFTPERMAVTQSVVSLFKDSWNFDRSILLNNSSDPNSGWVCPKDSELFEILGVLAGCNNDAYPSMFIPPQCLPYPEEQCAVQFNYPPTITNGQAQNQILMLNLSMVIAFANIEFMTTSNITLLAGGYNLIQATGSMQPPALNPCTVGGVDTNCFKRVHLPDYDSTCMYYFNGSYNSPYYCDYNPTYSYKASTNELSSWAPRVSYLLANMNMDDDDLQEQYDVYSATEIPDYKNAACQWILDNPTKWADWISAPAKCSLSDVQYFMDTDTSCMSDTSSMFHVTYQWMEPKACKEGIPLPVSQMFSCGYFQSADSNAQTVIVVSTVFLCPFVLLWLAYFVICMAGIEESKSAGANRVNLFEFTKVIQMRIRHNEKMKAMEEKKLKKEAKRAAKSNAGNPTNSTVEKEEADKPSDSTAASSSEELSYLHRFIVKYFKPFISMPILSIVGPLHTLLFLIGSILILYNSIVRATAGKWTSNLCWTNYILPFLGVTCISTCLVCGAYQLRQNHKKMIGYRSLWRVKMLTWLGLLLVFLILMGNYGSVDLLTDFSATLDTTATINTMTCSSIPVYVGAIVIGVNGIYALLSAFIVGAIAVDVLALHITSSSASSAMAVSLMGTSKGPTGGLYLNWGNRRFRRVNTMEVIHLKSMLTSVVVAIALLTIVFYTSYEEFNSPFEYSSSTMVSYRIPIDILTLLVGITWFGPSCWHVSDGSRHRLKKALIKMFVGNESEKEKERTKEKEREKGQKSTVRASQFGIRKRASAVHPTNNNTDNANSAEGGSGLPNISADNNDKSSGRSSSSDGSSSGAASSSTSSTTSVDSDDLDANELDNLRHVLQDPLCCVILEEFAESQFDSDNIKFLLVVKSFFHELSKAPNQWIVDRMKGRTGDSSNDSGNHSGNGNSNKAKALSNFLATQLNGSEYGLTANDILEGQSSMNISLTLKRCIMLLSDAEIICNEFVRDGAAHQLNISSMQRELVNNAMQIVKKFVHQHLQYEMNVRTTAKAGTLPNQLNYSQFAALCRQVFHAIVPEVFHLLNVNTYTRFLQSSHAQRANDLISWSYAFADLNEREQTAMIQRLQIQMKWNRMVANVDSINSSGGRGSTKMAIKEMEREVLNDGVVNKLNRQSMNNDIMGNPPIGNGNDDVVTMGPPATLAMLGKGSVNEDSDVEMGLVERGSTPQSTPKWKKDSIGNGAGGSAETKATIPTLLPMTRGNSDSSAAERLKDRMSPSAASASPSPGSPFHSTRTASWAGTVPGVVSGNAQSGNESIIAIIDVGAANSNSTV